MVEVVLEHINKVFPPHTEALKDLNLALKSGERLSIVGPSGSGKTTILRIIAGLEAPTHGTVRIGGRIVNNVPPSERGIGMVFQQNNLYPHMTIRQNLGFALSLQVPWTTRLASRLRRILAISDPPETLRLNEQIQGRVAEAARVLDLVPLLGRNPHTLSGGQQQRAALAKAVVRQSHLLLLDEPLAHLEPALRREAMGFLYLLHERLKMTVIYVTHDQQEAMAIGHRMAVLNQGTIQQVGTPQNIYMQPQNRFVAGFIGWPPMNFIEGRLFTRYDGCFFECPAWSPWRLSGKMRADKVHQGKLVTMGIRPDRVKIGCQYHDGVTLNLVVRQVETLGSAYLITLQKDDLRLVAQSVDQPEGMLGKGVKVGFDMRDAYFFSLENGMRIDRNSPDG
jgi:multiple sugar transport system ATP-binding protein